MNEHQAQFDNSAMSRALEVSRGGYCAWPARPQSARAEQDAVITEQIAVFPIRRGDRLLGERYAEHCQRMKPTQAMVAAMRKLLTLVWGAHRSAAAFDPARVHRCASQFALAA